MSLIVRSAVTTWMTSIEATVIVLVTQLVVAQGLITWRLKVVTVFTVAGVSANVAKSVIGYVVEIDPAILLSVVTPIAN